MLDPAQLAALAAVHRRGSFDLAAASLHVTPSAISQRIKALEETTGTLLIRRGQPCAATDAGLRLIRHHDEVALLESTLAADLPGLTSAPATLRIAVNADSLATWIIPALAATTGFLFDLVIDDQDVSQDWLKRGEVVAAVTSHAGPLQGCDTLPLGALRYRATASPGYIQRWFPNGLTSDALATAPAITFSDNDRLQIDWVARHIRPARRAAFPSHRMASSHAFVDACLHGLGWAMNPEPLAAPHLAAGSLVDLAPGTPLDVALHWQFTRLASPALAPVTEAVRRAARALLVQPP
ncbi:MAG: LysR family transcriptional regulator ArgP [Tabrizicola sp.]|uniref:LysR family transcriptional regulator ArgP n=1 Tax=Tabrizicola sp. TaxID=2005166 RepID=UPI002735D81E|nr:LysR family transcriptional regulator ArgP [Tabrizicola sp.]MDP3261465.1 LysR family transcriptional regulator ArgP [Tabrizicola sp.]MDP3649254.1 LysR family transcriptional regulator ArgP [Paracoccaceae bacterium]MDZ4069562.1 LysR family transcriptional regulator ArgP [Tabrizicola sp.]